MRFFNIIVALAAVAGITNALQIPSTEKISVERRGPPAKKPAAPVKQPVTAGTKPSLARCDVKKTSTKKKTPRGDETKLDFDEDNNIYRIYMGDFIDGSLVERGQEVRVTDVSGCSAAFFFDKAGRSSAAHITAGKETVEGKEAAKQAVEAKTTASVEVHAYETAKFNLIKAAILSVLPQIPVSYVPYTLNTRSRTERWRFSHISGDKSNRVTAATYNCQS